MVGIVTPDKVYSDKASNILVPDLQNQPYFFELSESLIREKGIGIIVDPLVRV